MVDRRGKEITKKSRVELKFQSLVLTSVTKIIQHSTKSNPKLHFVLASQELFLAMVKSSRFNHQMALYFLKNFQATVEEVFTATKIKSQLSLAWCPSELQDRLKKIATTKLSCWLLMLSISVTGLSRKLAEVAFWRIQMSRLISEE
jgi:hypothetical protein